MDKSGLIIQLAHHSIAIHGDIYSIEIAKKVGVSVSTVRKVLRRVDRYGGLDRQCTAALSSGRRCGAPLPREAWGRLGVTRCAAHTRLRVLSSPQAPAASVAEAGTGPVVEKPESIPYVAPVKIYPLSVLDDIDAPIPFRPAAPPMPEELATALDGLTVEVLEGEPRASAFQLAELLGFARPRKIKDLIERNREELADFGVICMRPTVGRTQMPTGGVRETTVDVPWLNRTQCLIVAMKVETPTAAEARGKIARSFEREQDRAAAPAPSVSPDIAALVQAVATLAATVATTASRLSVVEATTAPQRRPTPPPAPPSRQLPLGPAFDVAASAEAKGDYLSVGDIAERVGLPMDDRRESSKRLVTFWLQESGYWHTPGYGRNIRMGQVAGGHAYERDHWVYAPRILRDPDSDVLRRAGEAITGSPHMSTRRAYETARAVIRLGLGRKAS